MKSTSRHWKQSKILKTFVKALGLQNNQTCDKIAIEISNSPTAELTRPTQVTDTSDITVEHL